MCRDLVEEPDAQLFRVICRVVAAAMFGSCPAAWCNSDMVVTLSGNAGRFRQAATAGSMTAGSSPSAVMDSSVM